MSSRPATSRAFAVVEAVIAALIVGIMVAAALETVGKSRASQAWSADRIRAYELAAELLAEITDLPYADPQVATVILGPDSTEPAGGRAAYDDVDDYHNYTENPPRTRAGVARAAFTGWSRKVRVAWTSNTLPLVAVGSDGGVKQITVSVTDQNGRKLAELVSVRTSVVNR